MTTAKRRIDKLETGLTPKQIILLWFQEAHAFNSIEEYVRHLKTQPDSAAPIHKLTSQVEESVKQTLGSRPREEINKAVNQAYKDVLFLFYLHQQVNGKLLSENRYYWTKYLMLSKELKSLLREKEQNRQMRWNRVRVEMEMPYPLDAETAAAIEAAKQHHVITWEVLEEGDDIGEWVRDSFVAEGKTLLPDGAYLMRSGTKSSYTTVPTEDEVRVLFENPESFQQFLDGEDYSYGLSDVPDVEYDAHYEAIVTAVKGVIQPGTVINLPNVPHAFFKEAPLIEGDWIDSYTVELAEWGARLVEKGFLLEESDDNHPMAWQGIVDREDGSKVDATVTMNLWRQTKKHMLTFPGRNSVIDGRQYLSFVDYLKWKGRRNKGDLKSGLTTGLAVCPWRQWVNAQGAEGVATLAGVKVATLVSYLDGYRYYICQNRGELAEKVSRRESLLDSLIVGKLDSSDGERFRRRVEHWKESALGFLPEIFTLRRAINSIRQRYFDGQEGLFPNVAEGFDQLFASVEKLVGIYNEALAEDIERLEALVSEAVDGLNRSPLTIDLAELIESIQEAVRGQVAYMVDMAKADALDLLGETRQAFELVDRHV